MRRSWSWALLVLAALLLVPWTAGARPDNAPRATGLSIGQPPPELHTRHVAGPDPVSMGQLRGRVVILDFWATWCGPCRMIMPVLDRLHRNHHASGLTVLGISSESRLQIDAFLASRPVDYTVARDAGGTARRYEVRSIPMLIVVDRRGEVREVMRGVNGAQLRNLDSLVRRLLAEPAR